MSQFLKFVGILEIIGGIMYSIVFVAKDNGDNAMLIAIGIALACLISGCLYIAVGMILDKLDELQKSVLSLSSKKEEGKESTNPS